MTGAVRSTPRVEVEAEGAGAYPETITERREDT